MNLLPVRYKQILLFFNNKEIFDWELNELRNAGGGGLDEIQPWQNPINIKGDFEMGCT